MTEYSVVPLKATPGMPPRQPLAMPVQELDQRPRGTRPDPVPRAVTVARLITFGGAALLTALGVHEMIGVVAVGGVTILEAVMTAIFVVTFGWIALAASSAVAGAICPPAPPIRLARTGGRLQTRTALVMPIFHEDPVCTAARLQTMAHGLYAAGEAHAFEVVVLSDSTEADAWVRETLAVERLKSSLAGIMPVWYRRRWANTGKKAGNIKDFVEGWGGRYAHFIVLDADSMMTAEAIVTLAASMEVDSRLGILQTVPILAGGQTLFARMQQFAGRVYGPVTARGLAAWQGRDGNYWGHNAIIRTRAFAACCGLPDLPGKKPFGGAILSHDFVEAALMRRAGWRVAMAAELEGSWEESPPSLIDAAIRDRRWAQGNLQHAKVITARGLAWPSRVHLALGIMSYVASPVWLMLIVCGFALSVQAHFMRPEYFSDAPQLFPTWPHFDSERMIRLFILTMCVLLLPKLFGFVQAMAKPELRRGCGGAPKLTASFAAELVISALFAPVLMAIHSRQIYEILAGRDAGWSAQRRDQAGTDWREAWSRHRWHMACGLATALAAWFLSPAILAWLSASLAGLLFAVPLSRASGSARLGLRLRSAGLLVTPEEERPDPLLVELQEAIRSAPALPADAVETLIAEKPVRDAHFRWASSAPRERGAPDPAFLTAATKLEEARSREEALGWLAAPERLHVAGHRILAERLAGLPHGKDGGPAAALGAAPEPVDPPVAEPQIAPSAA